MEGEKQSAFPSDPRIGTAGFSDSNSSSAVLSASKRARYGSNVSALKFKGVVPQQNGNWGAQIYANHQRIWLGTFRSENEAAMAYDSAAIKLRSRDSHRNFEWTSTTSKEQTFQSHHSAEAVLNMIRDGTYQSTLSDFLRADIDNTETGMTLSLVRMEGNGGLMCTQLFQKELTPSDVSKLNRLVIPKKYAVKHFPAITKSVEGRGDGETVGQVNDDRLVFYDRSMRSWKFRYCYWSSSQSFVFTKGWNRFVKEKRLKGADVIAFYVCECREEEGVPKRFHIIDVNYKGESSDVVAEEGVSQSIGRQVELKLELVKNVVGGGDEEKVEEEESMGENVIDIADRKSFKLFGVQIM